MEEIIQFDNISQRVVSARLKMLSPAEASLTEPQRDLHGFFQAFYQQLFDQPQAFGLPLTADDALTAGEPNEKDHKQEITRKMKKAHEVLAQALDFLMHAGSTGILEGAALCLPLDDFCAAIKRSRNHWKLLQSLQLAGLSIIDEGQSWRLENSQFPAMMSALQALAQACAAHPNANTGKLNFARCDLNALSQADYSPDVLELYRAFDPADTARLETLHRDFTEHGYKTDLQVGGTHTDWVVKYQGSKKVKATPLFQVEFQDRYRKSLQIQIKCASTARVAPLLAAQSETLQADFIQRASRCRGDECGWCRNNKTLGPSLVPYKGETLTLCWYTYPMINNFNESAVDLVKEYARMHEAMAA